MVTADSRNFNPDPVREQACIDHLKKTIPRVKLSQRCNVELHGNLLCVKLSNMKKIRNNFSYQKFEIVIVQNIHAALLNIDIVIDFEIRISQQNSRMKSASKS